MLLTFRMILFLLDPSPIIGYACLSCEDGNSKLVEVLTVVDVDDQNLFFTDLVALLKFRIKVQAGC